MQHDIKILESTLRKTKLYLTVWFALVGIVSIVLVVLGNLFGIVTLLCCIGYISSLFQKDVIMKLVGFWLHAILSGLAGIFYLFAIAVLSWFARRVRSPATTGIIIAVLIICLVYIIVTIAAIFGYWKHCKAAKNLKKIRERNDSTYAEQGVQHNEAPLTQSVQAESYNDRILSEQTLPTVENQHHGNYKSLPAHHPKQYAQEINLTQIQ